MGWRAAGEGSGAPRQKIASVSGVDEHDLAVFQRGHLELIDVLDRSAVASVHSLAADLDRADSRHEIAAPVGAEFILYGFAGLDGRAGDPRIGAELECVLVSLES